MARETQTIEVHALGAVTFLPLGKVAMERAQEEAKRTAVSEDLLLVSRCVTEPRFGSNEELLAALKGHNHVIGDIADAIRAASWPSRTAG
jgi:hypothetical protein